jgi:hypothetical protein
VDIDELISFVVVEKPTTYGYTYPMPRSPFTRLRTMPHRIPEREFAPGSAERPIDGKRISEMTPEEYAKLADASVRIVADKKRLMRKRKRGGGALDR